MILFKDDDDFQFFLAKYIKYFSSYLETYAYCLIPNHFHFLIRVKNREEIEIGAIKEQTKAIKRFISEEISINELLSNQFKRFFSSVSIKYNNKYKHEGPIFIRKLKRIKVSKNGTIQYLVCYIHHNPIHHGLANNFEDWNFSSYNSYYSKHSTNIAKNIMLEWLGGLNVFDEIHDSLKIERKEVNLE